jgi:hypothetical protein
VCVCEVCAVKKRDGRRARKKQVTEKKRSGCERGVFDAAHGGPSADWVGSAAHTLESSKQPLLLVDMHL